MPGPARPRWLPPAWALEIAPMMSVLLAVAVLISVVGVMSLTLLPESHPGRATHVHPVTPASTHRLVGTADRDDPRARAETTTETS